MNRELRFYYPKLLQHFETFLNLQVYSSLKALEIDLGRQD